MGGVLSIGPHVQEVLKHCAHFLPVSLSTVSKSSCKDSNSRFLVSWEHISEVCVPQRASSERLWPISFTSAGQKGHSLQDVWHLENRAGGLG